MGLFANITAGLRALLGRKKVEREMDEELRSFLDASAEEKRRAGMTLEQAAYAARVEMGSTNAVKHQVWSSRWESTVDSLLQDLRYSIRILAKSPSFTLVAVASLALGIGANTAIFTLVHAILLRSLPVANPAQLYRIGDIYDCCVEGGFPGDVYGLGF